jgi:hypothetical protein
MQKFREMLRTWIYELCASSETVRHRLLLKSNLRWWDRNLFLEEARLTLTTVADRRQRSLAVCK